ncbi:TPA: LPXTG cell wall anchor domain-containing protein, partial [Enterococcus faecium]|nr:LPXTG cell wall anchor domain-containing protein [Enterococcus faecium]
RDASSHRGSHLPRTGAEIAATAGIAALIVLGGVVTVVVARRRGGK